MSACAGLATLAVAGTAGAMPVDVEGFTMLGAGPTAWDGAVDDFVGGAGDVDGCYVRDGYSPVSEGATFAGRKLRSEVFHYGLLFGAAFGQAALYPADGKGDFNARSNTMTVGPSPLSGLSATRKDTAMGRSLRTLVKLRNPGDSAFDDLVTWDSSLDTDEVAASSNDDGKLTPSDRWVVVGSPSPGYYGYQGLAFALYGKGAREKTDNVDFEIPGNNCVTVDYAIQVPAGATRYLLFFTEQHPNSNVAEDSVRKYNRRHIADRLLRGIPKAVRAKVLNWDL